MSAWPEAVWLKEKMEENFDLSKLNQLNKEINNQVINANLYVADAATPPENPTNNMFWFVKD